MQNGAVLAGLLHGALLATFVHGQQWQRIAANTTPPPMRMALAFDEDRNLTVAAVQEQWGPFGPTGLTTWEWDSERWFERASAIATAPSFPPWHTFDLAFDKSRNAVVLCEEEGATWSFDGIDWHLLANPSANTSTPSLAFDVAHNQLVKFGYGQLYAFTNGAWTAIGQPIINGFPLDDAQLAWHGASNRIVLFGGAFGLNYSDRTFTWDGATWTEEFPATTPPGRIQHQLTATSAPGNLVVTGGFRYDQLTGISTTLDDVYEWDGSNWLAAPSLPNHRDQHAMANGPGGVILMNGTFHSRPTMLRRTNGAFVDISQRHIRRLITVDLSRNRTVSVVDNQTLEFDGATWADTGVATPPDLIMLSYHHSTARCVAIDLAATTWLYDGTAWFQATPATTPNVTWDAGTCYDVARDRIVMHGGTNPNTLAATNETWEWNGSDWLLRTPASVPLMSTHATLCFNSSTQRCFLITTNFSTGPQHVAYEWDGVNWTVASTSLPAFSIPHVVDYAPTGIAVVSDAGATLSIAETSFFDGSTWTPGPAILDNQQHLLAFDPIRQAIVAHSPSSEHVMTASPAVATHYGSGCTSGTSPELRGVAVPDLGAPFRSDVIAATANSFVILFASLQSANISLPGGCSQLVANPIALGAVATSANGFASTRLTVPLDPALRGLSVFEQALCLAPNGALLGFATLTNGVELTIGG